VFIFSGIGYIAAQERINGYAFKSPGQLISSFRDPKAAIESGVEYEEKKTIVDAAIVTDKWVLSGTGYLQIRSEPDSKSDVIMNVREAPMIFTGERRNGYVSVEMLDSPLESKHGWVDASKVKIEKRPTHKIFGIMHPVTEKK
jgi:hypothetical protein